MNQKASITETIAIIAWGAMADVLYATPIVRHIRKLHPAAKIDWLVRDKFAQVVEGNPDIDYVVPFTLPDGHASRQDAEYVMDGLILEYAKSRYDKFYDLQYWPRYSNFYQNPTEDFVALRARNAGLDPGAIQDRRIVLDISDADEHAALSFMLDNDLGPLDSMGRYPRFITVNHISYAASPVWSLENYQLLVGYLKNRDIRCIFTGAPNEPIPKDAIDARGMPYKHWAALIDNSDLWLGLDSGAVALACATETPIIKLHSRDFPLAKTGIKAMGLRTENVLELCPAPNPGSLTDIIEGMLQ